MTNQGRVFGRNMYYFMKKNSIKNEDLAEKTGYSVIDIAKIKDARLFLPREDMESIANVLRVSVDDLLDEELCKGEKDPLIECRGEFSSEENKDKILDLFDAYCDIQEMLSQ